MARAAKAEDQRAFFGNPHAQRVIWLILQEYYVELTLNNVIEQDHRILKRRVKLAMGYGSFRTAWRTIQGIGTMHRIRKGRIRRVAKGDVVAQVRFLNRLFGVAVERNPV